MPKKAPVTALEVRVLPLADLTPAPYNPRRALRPGDKAYEKLARSLREFGLVEPLIWNEATGHVVGGHARLRILKAHGVKEVPVSVVRLSPAREKALNVLLNNREAQGRFDPNKLADLLTELEELPESTLTGFDPDALAALRLEPAGEVAVEEATGQVEVTLVITAEAFEQVRPRLDELIGEYDLACHVRRV
jgi:ParB-like chromosome segregation protein Spo0J